MRQHRNPLTARFSTRDALCQSKPQRLRWWLLLTLSILGSAPHFSLAADGPTSGMPPDIERLVRWLPEDTETLVVAQSVTLAKSDPRVALRWPDVGIDNALYEFKVDSSEYLEPLLGRKIRLIVRGGKSYEVVSSFGSLRGESSTILLFAENLGDAGRKLIDGLRKNADSVRTILGREVYVFPLPIKKEPWVRRTTWEGTYFVLLKPDTLLYSTSDRHLEEVLRRVDEARGTRALPDDLPEWKHVNFTAPAWIVRHFPNVGRDVHTIGMTAEFADGRFQVVYIPKPGFAQDMDNVHKQWFSGPVAVTSKQRQKFKLERKPDGTIAFSTGDPPDLEDDSLIWFWQCTRLQALDLFWYP